MPRPKSYKGRGKSPRSPQSRWKQGVFTPINRKKFRGLKLPYYRSSLELKFMKILDTSSIVEEWWSEEPKVPYVNPNANGRVWNYHPDFVIKFNDGNKIWFEMIEVKPYKQTLQPKGVTKGRSVKLVEHEQSTWAMNKAKWEAAIDYCNKRNWIFKIITEKDIN